MYTISETKEYTELCGLKNFSINKIFDCGQCFRFDPKDNGVGGIANGKYIYFEQIDSDKVRIYGISKAEFEKTWKGFLALDEDYTGINEDIKLHLPGDTIIKAMEYGDGIRILRQDGWEALCSFIISQNNNIPRIKGIIENMSRRFGEKIGEDMYAFPTADSLCKAGVDELFALKTGFRAKYIYDAAEKVSSGKIDLSLIDKMTTQEALDYLMQIKGVGLKVASCTLLFGFHKTDAFPVDVWVKRVLEKYYPDGLDIENLGAYAGIAQQYLFYYERYNSQK